ncbi:BREX-1 system adenine-specific DNA-methyltransferase PglX [Viridibacillus arvi]|uniref:BREX-1 system adenine-specific DNA-methyltransferase PglX n=1 Tax=Viridibacillus arvi TaxID=263475 RepID=UPI003CFF0012
MNKSALKKFATEARKELLERVELQARKIGITADSIQKATVESSDAVFIDGRQLSDIERRQRNKLIKRIEEIGFNRVMEETAYTWFNRFIALRFMEVNDYLPTKVRVLSSYNADSAEPDMMKEALSLDLELDKEYVYELKMANKTDELFKYLIKVHCNDLNHYMPFMFETIEDYKEILFPEGLLGTDSFVRQMTNPEVIVESDWESVEIIGWLYQYYISEEKDEVFENLRKNIKITKDKLPAATQLFTPNWIVRYMVENSLGRIWMESYPGSVLRNGWKYFLDEAEQEEIVIKQLKEIRYKNVNPEEITFLDPCCGSGHILVYAFDVFYEMYLDKGYVENEIPQLILSKNLFGLDVDDRAVQLASFAVMMKAREKSRRIFRTTINLNICAIQESNWMTDETILSIAGNNKYVQEMLYSIKNTFLDAKEYGSLLTIEPLNYELLEERFMEYKEERANLLELIEKQDTEVKLPHILKQAKILGKCYDVVCTNPPYMGRSGMNSKLTRYLDQYHSNAKLDLFASFIEKGFKLTKSMGFNSMLTMQSWMFLSSYEKLRASLVYKDLTCILHLGPRAFEDINGDVVQTVAFVFRNTHINRFVSTCDRLVDIDNAREKEKVFLSGLKRCYALKANFEQIPAMPYAYWISPRVLTTFENSDLGSLAEIVSGMTTGNNDKYLKSWYELSKKSIAFNKTHLSEINLSQTKWIPYNKGGEQRKWYGNNEFVVNWSESDNFNRAKTTMTYLYLKPCITWSDISGNTFAGRFCDVGFMFDVKGSCGFAELPKLYYLIAILNSKITPLYIEALNPTTTTQVGDLKRIPLIVGSQDTVQSIEEVVKENIEISKLDWNSFEFSWDFGHHPFITYRTTLNQISDAFLEWKKFKVEQIAQLKANEEKLNRILINIYELQEELTPEVREEDVTIRKDNLERDIKSFISYAVGCSFGRYSLDEEGLIFAGGEFDASRYKAFPADEDNILPILPGAFFEDDIVTKFVDFVRVTFSEETLEENLDFIADAIGRKKTETAREAIRRYFLNDFFKDHVQIYKKRPIYWLFSSGKEKAFNCLIYMHRYNETTLSRIRTDYLHEVQIRMDAEKKDLLSIIEGDYTTKEISNAKKELKSLDKKIDELKAYDELLHHMADKKITIDLDDGVKHNYDLFKGLVAKI